MTALALESSRAVKVEYNLGSMLQHMQGKLGRVMGKMHAASALGRRKGQIVIENSACASNPRMLEQSKEAPMEGSQRFPASMAMATKDSGRPELCSPESGQSFEARRCFVQQIAHDDVRCPN